MSLTGDVRLRVDDSGHKPEGSERRKLRGDIEGLRAVAVVVVLLYHAGAPFLPGGFVGVDVFFVISGFLITTLLVKELAGTGTISLPGFYARRAKRLLPATAVVLLFVAAGTALLLPPTRWVSTAWDVVASSFYGINWRLASQSVDYLAMGVAPSPVQHFWSLAVEEQFYLVWPLLLLLATWWVRPRVGRYPRQFLRGRGGATSRRLTLSLYLGLAAIAVPSLAWSIHLTTTNAGPAYFVTTTRMWELAIGGGIAIGAARLAGIPPRVAAVLGWVGLAAVVGTGFILTSATPFPGSVALIPTLGTAAVIASGPAAGLLGPVRVLGLAPMRWVGGLSYSLYLWHWPLIVLVTARLGEELTLAQGLVVVLATLLPAYLSFRYVEEPVRRARPLRTAPLLALRLGLVCTLVGAFSGVGLLMAIWTASSTSTASVPFLPAGDSGRMAGSPKFGAEVLRAQPLGDPLGRAVDEVVSISPDPLDAQQDFAHDCTPLEAEETEVRACVYGTPGSKPYILVLGDSHAQQWVPALKAIAQGQGGSLVAHAKASCPFIQGEVGSGSQTYTSCIEWNRKVRQALATGPTPDLVILSNRMFPMVEGGRVLTGPANDAKVVDALRATIREFTDAGVPVAVIRDTPAPRVNIPDCIASHTDDLTACATPRSQALQGSAQLAAVKGVNGAHLIDLTDAICPSDPCAPVIGGVMVWRDQHHLTRTYVYSLTARLQAMILPLVKGS
jgi:peptidoglycan/LPS O-acetylase OafA/YrhL